MTLSVPVRRTGRPAAYALIDRVMEMLRRPFFARAGAGPEESTKLIFVPEEAVAKAIEVWQERALHLPDQLLSDPAWRMLLELLEAEIQNRRVSALSLYNVSAVPPRAAARWLNALQQRGLVVRRPDPLNPNNEFVELSRKGSSALRRYFHSIRTVQTGS